MIDCVFLSEKKKHMENSKDYRSHHRGNSLFPEKSEAGLGARFPVSSNNEESRETIRNSRAKKNGG